MAKNCELNLDDDGILTIVIDTKQDFGKSSSGKSNVVASSEGFIWEQGVGVSLNVIRK